MNERFVKGHVVPPSIGLCADEYRFVRDVRLAMAKDVEKVKAREDELYEHMINSISKSRDTGASGKIYRVQRVPDAQCIEPKAEDWAATFAYIQQTGRFDLVQKRLSETAVKEMWEAGESVPGVGKIIVPKLSVTKI